MGVEFIYKMIVLVLVTAIVIYGFVISESFRKGPVVNVYSPINGDSVLNTVEVIGNVSGASYLTLNDRQIFVERDGDFEETISLPKGYNVLKLYARDNSNREVEKILHILVKEKDAGKKINEEKRGQ